MLSWLFPPRKTPKERLRECKSELRANGRSLEREIDHLKRMEHSLIREIKVTAQQGNTSLAKIMCTNLITIRNGIEQLYRAKCQIDSIRVSLTVNHSTETMATAMRGATRAMGMANRQVNVRQIQQTMERFEKNQHHMELKQDIMNDTIGMNGDELEADEVLEQVMDEIGLDILNQVGDPPRLNGANAREKVYLNH